MPRVVRLAQLTVVTNLGVILAGAVVRATGSGAGCGRSWPTCHGQWTPAMEGATAIELTHRISSGLALLMVAALVWAVFRATEPRHRARRGVVWAAVAILGEALIGALIVLYEWVAGDVSTARVVSVPLHLVNTLLLLAALTLTWFWLTGGGPLSRGKGMPVLVLLGLGMLGLGATGAITALADTLFPKTSFGLSELTGGEHLLTRLRLIHPVAAAVVGGSAAIWASRVRGRLDRPDRDVATAIIWLVALQMAAGLLNILLHTPLWLQLLHLALADILWIAWVWMAATLLSAPGWRSREPGNRAGGFGCSHFP